MLKESLHTEQVITPENIAECIKNNELEKIKQINLNDFDFNQILPDEGLSPLVLAILEGREAIALHLIEDRGVDYITPIAIGSQNISPWFFALDNSPEISLAILSCARQQKQVLPIPMEKLLSSTELLQKLLHQPILCEQLNFVITASSNAQMKKFKVDVTRDLLANAKSCYLFAYILLQFPFLEITGDYEALYCEYHKQLQNNIQEILNKIQSHQFFERDFYDRFMILTFKNTMPKKAYSFLIEFQKFIENNIKLSDSYPEYNITLSPYQSFFCLMSFFIKSSEKRNFLIQNLVNSNWPIRQWLEPLLVRLIEDFSEIQKVFELLYNRVSGLLKDDVNRALDNEGTTVIDIIFGETFQNRDDYRSRLLEIVFANGVKLQTSDIKYKEAIVNCSFSEAMNNGYNTLSLVIEFFVIAQSDLALGRRCFNFLMDNHKKISRNKLTVYLNQLILSNKVLLTQEDLTIDLFDVLINNYPATKELFQFLFGKNGIFNSLINQSIGDMLPSHLVFKASLKSSFKLELLTFMRECGAELEQANAQSNTTLCTYLDSTTVDENLLEFLIEQKVLNLNDVQHTYQWLEKLLLHVDIGTFKELYTVLKKHGLKQNFSTISPTDVKDTFYVLLRRSSSKVFARQAESLRQSISMLLGDNYLPPQERLADVLSQLNFDKKLDIMLDIFKHLVNHHDHYPNFTTELMSWMVNQEYQPLAPFVLPAILSVIKQAGLIEPLLTLYSTTAPKDYSYNEIASELLRNCDTFIPALNNVVACQNVLLMMLGGNLEATTIQRFFPELKKNARQIYSIFKNHYANNRIALAYALESSSPLSEIFSAEEKLELKSLHQQITLYSEDTVAVTDPEIATRNALLQKKQLPIWENESGPIFSDSIDKHAAWISEQIYQHNYLDKSPREHHGDMHVNRALLWGTSFTNLSRIFSLGIALGFDEHDIKLIQIALLFHDCARENDGEDYWDRESAELLYYYLTTQLHLNKELAALVAEAAANKDYRETEEYYQFQLNEEGKINWIPSRKPILVHYHDYIHDGDCLDIRRCVPEFDGRYLAFYRNIAMHDDKAMIALAQLIREATHLIDDMCDGLNTFNPEQKRLFETNRQCYQNMLAILSGNEDYDLCRFLHTVLPLNAESVESIPLRELLFPEAKKDEVLLLRGIRTPARIFSREKSKNGETVIKARSSIELELYKTYRRPDPEKHNKNGNPKRSATAWLPGGQVFSSAGFFASVPLEQIESVSTIDNDSGHGKKDRFKTKENERGVIAQEIAKLAEEQRLSCKSRPYQRTYQTYELYYASHNEIIATLTEFKAIYFCCGDNILNISANPKNNIFSFHEKTPFLEALFIYQSVKLQQKIELPIYYINLRLGIWQFIQPPDEETIFQVWQEVMIAAFAKVSLKMYSDLQLSDCSRAKIYGTYGSIEAYDEHYANCTQMKSENIKDIPLDHLSSAALQGRISGLVISLQQRYEEAVKLLDSVKYNIQLLKSCSSETKLTNMIMKLAAQPLNEENLKLLVEINTEVEKIIEDKADLVFIDQTVSLLEEKLEKLTQSKLTELRLPHRQALNCSRFFPISTVQNLSPGVVHNVPVVEHNPS